MAAAASCYRHRLRYVLLVFLCLNLIMTAARQVFDLMGYVWTPIAANFLNVIFVIFAIFAAAQFRTRFFIVYLVWMPFWLAWNAFLICYYLNIGILNRDDARPLSWGTGGRSWWSRHTPGCQRIYNATSATVEIGECQFIHPSYVEIIQAAVHLLLTIIILILTALFIHKFPRKLVGEPYSSLPRRRSASTRPHVTVEIGPTPPSISAPQVPSTNSQTVPANPADISFARSSDVSSGYLNVSYDASPAARKLSGGPIIPNGNNNGNISRPPPPQPLQNYRRNSHKRRSSNGGGRNGSVQRRTREKSRERGQSHHDLPSTDQHHRSPRSTSVEEQPRSRSNSLTGNQTQQPVQLPNTIRTAGIRQSQRLSRPMQDLDDLLSCGSTPAPPSRATTAVVESSDSASSSPVQEEHRRQPIVRTYKRDPTSDGRSANVIDYSMEPRRVGAATSCNGISGHQPFRPSDPVRRSVISFDPKSDGDTLLRFHDHLARSQETILSRASTSTQPNQHQHFTAPDVVSFDSGLPPSHGTGSDDDPRLSRESQTFSNSFAAARPQRQPIGYEPAFMMSYEPASSQDEPIYRPSFLRSAASGHSPVKFRYDDKLVNAPSGIKPNTAVDKRNVRPMNGNARTNNTDVNGRLRNGHPIDMVSNDSSESEVSNDAGLAVPRISNASLLV